jgi:hypothetical protein
MIWLIALFGCIFTGLFIGALALLDAIRHSLSNNLVTMNNYLFSIDMSQRALVNAKRKLEKKPKRKARK